MSRKLLALSLDDDQLAKVMAGAERVPSAWRRRYLERPDLLLHEQDGRPSDKEVESAVGRTLARIGRPVWPQCF